MEKLNFLKNIEEKNKMLCVAAQPVQVDQTKPKKFITFPYAYMNGRLHLGHCATILNADMQARFYELCGFNVLFPWGCHGSGMPIVASAKKLTREINYVNENNINLNDEYIMSLPLNNQLRILREMKIPIDKLCDFTDPYNWIIYFSLQSQKDVKLMDPFIDFTRTFYTTDLNKHYDSFITWQFEHLIQKGLVYKGTRNMIYSELDLQPCADHDRATGENVEPVKINTFVFNKFLVTDARTKTDSENCCVVCGKFEYVKIILNGIETILSQKAYNNIKHQYKTEFISNVDIKDVFNEFIACDNAPNWGTGIFLVNDEQFTKNSENTEVIKFNDEHKIFSYYEPESTVISRSGDICVVASTEQWFIDYGNQELKQKVLNFVKTQFESPTENIKEQIEKAIENMHERACSRNFGLGTKIPGTNEIIDSLSDSTIYMAYYTVAHIINTMNIEELTHSIWDYIFLGIGEPSNETIKNARDAFIYWYPVDIRVSGKDLVTSHLTYSLFNHMAIWNDDKYMPKSYYVNGHLMLNCNKMSKSTGNFLTLYDAIEKYGSNATRFSIAHIDGIDDGNFTNSNAITGISKLTNEINFISDNVGAMSSHKFVNIQQYEYFEYQVKSALKNAYNSYKNAIYSDVVKSFHAIISAKDEYIKKTRTVEHCMIKLYCDSMYTLMYPICPTWAKEIELILNDNGYKIDINWFVEYSNPSIVRYQFYADVMKYVKDEINRLVPKLKKQSRPAKILIEVIKNFSEEEQMIISNISDLPKFYENVKDKRKMGIYKGFAKHITKNIEQYGELWLTWTNSSTMDEFEYIKNEISFIHNGIIMDVQIVSSNDEYQFKNNPGRPKISQIFI